WPLRRFQDLDAKRLIVASPLLFEKLPFFFLALISSSVTFLVQQRGGAVLELTRLSLGERLENAIVSYGTYLAKSIWPHRLSVFYPMPDSWPLTTVLFTAALLVLATAIAILLRKDYPYFFFGWFWFLLTLVPVIGFVQVGWQAMADRYTYI